MVIFYDGGMTIIVCGFLFVGLCLISLLYNLKEHIKKRRNKVGKE